MLENRGASNFLAVFYARRALRILPLYWLLLAAFAASSTSAELSVLMASV